MVAFIALVIGIALVVAGVAFVYWPAALVTAGAAVVALSLFVDPATLRRSRT